MIEPTYRYIASNRTGTCSSTLIIFLPNQWDARYSTFVSLRLSFFYKAPTFLLSQSQHNQNKCSVFSRLVGGEMGIPRTKDQWWSTYRRVDGMGPSCWKPSVVLIQTQESSESPGAAARPWLRPQIIPWCTNVLHSIIGFFLCAV